MLIIILVSGKSQAGKDTFFEIARSSQLNASFYRFGFADYVKETAKLIGWDGKKDERGITFLQELGYCARRYDCHIWTRRIDDFIIGKNLLDRNEMDVVIVTDCRYEDQIHYVKRKYQRVFCVRIERVNYQSALTPDQKNHASENCLDRCKAFDYILMNESLSDYKIAVLEVLSKIAIEAAKI